MIEAIAAFLISAAPPPPPGATGPGSWKNGVFLDKNTVVTLVAIVENPTAPSTSDRAAMNHLMQAIVDSDSASGKSAIPTRLYGVTNDGVTLRVNPIEPGDAFDKFKGCSIKGSNRVSRSNSAADSPTYVAGFWDCDGKEAVITMEIRNGSVATAYFHFDGFVPVWIKQ